MGARGGLPREPLMDPEGLLAAASCRAHGGPVSVSEASGQKTEV